MASLINVQELYDEVAVATGFPIYSNETDTPDTTRFLLEILSQALHSILDSVNTNNSTVERTDEIKTIEGQDIYGVDGIIKHIEVIDDLEKVERVPYLNYFDFNKTNEPDAKKDKPKGYVIKNRYLRLVPIPDKEYTIRMVLSSRDLVLADDDIFRQSITSINDRIIGTDDFKQVLALRAIGLVFTRCNNNLAGYYNQLAQDRLKSYLERTYGSTEAIRLNDRNSGHFNVRRGLLG